MDFLTGDFEMRHEFNMIKVIRWFSLEPSFESIIAVTGTTQVEGADGKTPEAPQLPH